jgi:anhydro-N-acetylmuramic acid kinase
VPVFHRALAGASGLALPAAVLNLGGVGNITFLPRQGDPVAFDTGPANALIDDLMLERTGAAFDRDGATAAAGRVEAGIVDALMRHPYFDAPPPKSLDRNAWSREPVAALPTADAAATLTDFTAATVERALSLLPARPGVLVVCGGGARNPTLMARLGARLPCRVLAADDLGWTGDAVEAQAFAYLAVRSRLGLPITFPGTTGVRAPLTGGVFFDARG